MTFEHYILTRFNLSFFEGVDNARCDYEYLRYRFHLFEKYCMPSIVGQTCQNFKWLVLLDIHTPPEFKKKMQEYHEAYNNLVPCYLDAEKYKEIPSSYKKANDDYEDIINSFCPSHPYDLKAEEPMRFIIPLFIMDAIKKCSGMYPDFYITTRIDNDDAFHKDMVKSIQQRFGEQPRKIVYDFVYTYKYILHEGIIYRYTLQNGHFISLVEPANELFLSVLYCNHLYADKFYKIEHIYQKTMQIELIHGKNVVNDFTDISCGGMLYAFFHFKAHDFGFRKMFLSPHRFIHIFLFLIKQKLLKKLSHV